MFDLSRVKVLHIEATSRCNAACPMCNRFEGDEINPKLTLQDLSLEKVRSSIDLEFASNLDKMFMCGNHGDPAASAHALEIYEWFREVNPSITLGMNTNGGLRNTDWWSKLGKILNRERDYVIFSIDGLEDTNHIYRRNVIWPKLMENAQAFISAGGRAHWEMLIFKHNEHQVEHAEKLSREMGFVFFRTKISRRFSTRPVSYLAPPERYHADFHSTAQDIDCMALKDRSIYMDYLGRLLPCCWLGVDAVNHGKIYSVQGFVPNKENATCLRTCSTSGKNNFEKQWI